MDFWRYIFSNSLITKFVGIKKYDADLSASISTLSQLSVVLQNQWEDLYAVLVVHVEKESSSCARSGKILNFRRIYLI
jgi:hypothetical protein